MARLDVIEREYWEAWERSKKDGQQRSAKTITGKNERTEAHKEEWTRDGNPTFLAGIERCSQARLAIFEDIFKDEFSKLTDEELDRQIKELEGEVCQEPGGEEAPPARPTPRSDDVSGASD